jgi:hypothetical protein
MLAVRLADVQAASPAAPPEADADAELDAADPALD